MSKLVLLDDFDRTGRLDAGTNWIERTQTGVLLPNPATQTIPSNWILENFKAIARGAPNFYHRAVNTTPLHTGLLTVDSTGLLRWEQVLQVILPPEFTHITGAPGHTGGMSTFCQGNVTDLSSLDYGYVIGVSPGHQVDLQFRKISSTGAFIGGPSTVASNLGWTVGSAHTLKVIYATASPTGGTLTADFFADDVFRIRFVINSGSLFHLPTTNMINAAKFFGLFSYLFAPPPPGVLGPMTFSFPDGAESFLDNLRVRDLNPLFDLSEPIFPAPTLDAVLTLTTKALAAEDNSSGDALTIPPHYSEVIQDRFKVHRLNTDDGYPIQRPAQEKNRPLYAIEIPTMDETEKSTLRTLFTTIGGRARVFNWTDPQTSIVHKFRTVSARPRIALINPGVWSASFEAEEAF